ncbi:MAG: Flp family type IVb pilin, partial [Chloroflexi bacterium]|nr:Flp family type IVb pilin [Chloroflexota bacterium]
EYGLIIALVAVVAIAGMTIFGDDISLFLETLGGKFVF